ncbi:thymocyte nuclear protein 1 [Biomphalaria glabrata]|nr:thymocyte nuclear protein 1-like [Biomphalaria glabrata]
MPPKRASLKRKISHRDETNEQDVPESVGKTKKKSVTKAEKNNTTKSLPSEKSKSKPSACASQSYKYWLIKSEPNSRIENSVEMKFSFNDLQSSPNQTSSWDGVRNYQARNFLRDQMKPGQDVFFYHSNCKEPGIVGICQVVKEGYPDHTQFDSKNPHFDSSSQKDNPKWFMVDVKLVRPLKRFISLAELKGLHQEHLKSGGPLQKLGLFTRPRLSVQPITDEEWSYILELENKDA